MSGMIGYSEFIDLCKIDDPCDWGGFRVAGNGVYVIPPPDDVILFPAERAALTWHPTGNLLEPALRFPCTQSELQIFLKEIGEIEFLYTDEDSAELPTLRAQKPSIEALPALEPTKSDGASPDAPRLRAQERAILAKLVEMGHDPKALPKNPQGRPGIRAECRKALSGSLLFKGPTTFMKAWERLSVEDIKYSD